MQAVLVFRLNSTQYKDKCCVSLHFFPGSPEKQQPKSGVQRQQLYPSSTHNSLSHNDTVCSSVLPPETADVRLQTLTRLCFFKDSRTAVWGLEEWCECIRELQLSHIFFSFFHTDTHIQQLAHFETFLLAGFFRFPYSVSVSWGRETVQIWLVQHCWDTNKKVMQLV